MGLMSRYLEQKLAATFGNPELEQEHRLGAAILAKDVSTPARESAQEYLALVSKTNEEVTASKMTPDQQEHLLSIYRRIDEALTLNVESFAKPRE